MPEHVVISLGKRIKYNPKVVFYDLCKAYPSKNGHTGENHEKEVIMLLYKKLDHVIPPQQAGGIRQLVYSGKHVSATVLHEWVRIAEKKRGQINYGPLEDHELDSVISRYNYYGGSFKAKNNAYEWFSAVYYKSPDEIQEAVESYVATRNYI